MTHIANWTCNIKNIIITENLEKHLREHIYYKQIKNHLILNKQYPPTAVDNIDWVAVEQAAKSLTMSRKFGSQNMYQAFVQLEVL